MQLFYIILLKFTMILHRQGFGLYKAKVICNGSKGKLKKIIQEGRILVMKKFISAALVLAMSLTMLTGCGQKAEDGAKESNADDTITVISREDGSGTRGAFIELFGIQEEENGEKVDKTTDEASITNSTSVMMSSVANDVNGIGYISLGSLNDTVKAVKIDGAEASVDNVKAGNYKIVRPFNIVLGKKANDAANDFISYIMSSEGQQIIKDNGYISIDDAAPAYAATDATGKIVVGGSSSVSPVMEKLIEAYGKVNSNVKVELQTTDSTTGVSSTVDGSYDIGMASRELKDDETAQGVEAKTIAQDGIAVVVNNENSVDELSSEQVKSIFTGETTSWSDITK